MAMDYGKKQLEEGKLKEEITVLQLQISELGLKK